MPHMPISKFGRGLFDFDNFFGKSLDFFDPFDRWDLSLSPRNWDAFNWIREPPRLEDRPINKFRVTLPATGYDKSDISTNIIDNKLQIQGRHVNQQTGGDFDAREFKREFNLPRNIDASKITSFLTGTGTLVVEIPFVDNLALKNTERDVTVRSKSPSDFYRGDFLPTIVSDSSGSKKVQIDVSLPNYQPEEIQLTLKDKDLILKAETSSSTDDKQHYAKQYLYRQVTLPEETNTASLTSTFENGLLHIEAPLRNSERLIQIQR